MQLSRVLKVLELREVRPKWLPLVQCIMDSPRCDKIYGVEAKKKLCARMLPWMEHYREPRR